MKQDDSQLPEAVQTPTASLPVRVEPMMLTHLVLTGDAAQYEAWRARVERLRQANAVEKALDPQTRSLLASRAVWRQMRETGLLGTMVGLGMGAIWTSEVMRLFAVTKGMGWLTASLFLLPLPIAWYIGRRLWERAAIEGMKDHSGSLTYRKRMRGFTRAIGRSFGAGFGIAFTLVMLQGLLSAILTPAPSWILEIGAALAYGGFIGTLTGLTSIMLGPLIAQSPPEEGGWEPTALPASTSED